MAFCPFPYMDEEEVVQHNLLSQYIIHPISLIKFHNEMQMCCRLTTSIHVYIIIYIIYIMHIAYLYTCICVIFRLVL